jgi:Multicopper oxidase
MILSDFAYGVLFLLAGLVSGKDVVYDLHLETEIDNALSPDCMNVVEERRSLFIADGSFPGPLIEADEGDTIRVRVYNHDEAASVSIHFHGIHQKGTPYSDGASSITQCALGPLQTQEYVFLAQPPGTHYWHEHASFHYADGITGPIIVRPKDPEPFEYDDEQVSRFQWNATTENIFLFFGTKLLLHFFFCKDHLSSGLVH